MKTIRKIAVILAVSITVSLFTGCGSIRMDALFKPEQALKSPKIAGAYQGVQEALEKAVGDDIVLKYVSVDGERIAFCAHDLSGDGSKEMLAFYQQRDEGSIPRINLLKYYDEEWHSVQDIEPDGNDLLEITFSDFDSDGIDEMVTGWSVFNSKQSQLCVYKMENDLLVKRASEDYTAYTVCDIDGGGKAEIGIVLLDTVEKTSKISFYNFESDNFTMKSFAALDGNVTSYSKLQTAKMPNGVLGLYIDAYKAPTTMITELVYFDGGKLFSQYYDAKLKENFKTLRYSELACQDINNDGYLEIPTSIASKGVANATDNSQVYLVKWVSFDGKQDKEVFTAWYSPHTAYYIEFDKNWKESVSVSYDADNKIASFGLWNNKSKSTSKELFKIKTFDLKQWQENSEQYFEIAQNDSYVWGALIINGDSGLDITKEGVLKRFKTVSN